MHPLKRNGKKERASFIVRVNVVGVSYINGISISFIFLERSFIWVYLGQYYRAAFLIISSAQ